MAGLVNPIKSTSLYEISVDTANPCNYGDCRPFSVFLKTVYTKAKAKNKRKMARVSNLPSRRDYWQGLPVCTIACTLIPFTVLKQNTKHYNCLVHKRNFVCTFTPFTVLKLGLLSLRYYIRYLLHSPLYN